MLAGCPSRLEFQTSQRVQRWRKQSHCANAQRQNIQCLVLLAQFYLSSFVVWFAHMWGCLASHRREYKYFNQVHGFPSAFHDHGKKELAALRSPWLEVESFQGIQLRFQSVIALEKSDLVAGYVWRPMWMDCIPREHLVTKWWKCENRLYIFHESRRYFVGQRCTFQRDIQLVIVVFPIALLMRSMYDVL